MIKSSTLNHQQFDLYWQGTLADYITAIAWSSDGETLAISSAAGEVVLWHSSTLVTLQTSHNASVDQIAFSHDGQFLAVGGQDKQVKIWRWRENQLIATWNSPAWVDKLAWSPTRNQLAFNLGRSVQVWDADTSEIAATLNFDNSSILSLDWHPQGEYLAIAGYQGAKIWHSQDWNDDPYVMVVPSASLAIAWSPDGEYLATGNMDRTITVWQWNNPHPWVMRGFPGKIRQLAWSEAKTGLAPLLASCSLEGIVLWSKQADELQGWEGRVLSHHTETVQAIAFQPHSCLLASAAEDGCVCLWHKAKQLTQVLHGASGGFSCLAWQPQAQKLAAGGQNGELLIWKKAMRGQGFGCR